MSNKHSATDERLEVVNLTELEERARSKLTKMAYDYYASGAGDEITLAENCAAYKRIQILPHMLVDVSRRKMETTVLGIPVSMPILIAPTAFHGLATDQAEIATAKAAADAGTIFTLSTLSNTSVEDVLAATSGTVWFQLYAYKDRQLTADLVKRAESAGAKAIVLTVDAPVLGRRERDVRNQFQLPPHLSLRNLHGPGLQSLPDEARESGLAAYFASLSDSSLSFKDIDWLRSITKLPIAVKGILRADDAVEAVKHGAAAIIVSNHGGRQLDTVPATISALPAITQAVGSKAEVYVDGGIRRGTDVFKALAYGARAVLIGRPILWGLALAGQQGAHAVLEALRAEFDQTMALAGCPALNSITRDLVQ